MVIVSVLGGSTNAVLHLIAMARAAGVKLTIDDFQSVSNRVPLLADFKPSGQYVMEDLHAVGGIPGVIKLLLDEKMFNGDCLTVTGKTIRENVKDLPGLSPASRSFILSRIRSRRPATSRFSKAISRRKVRSPKSRAKRELASPALPTSSIPKKPCSKRSRKSKFIRAT